MDQFMPSKNILKAINFDDCSHRQYTIFPANAPEFGLVSYLESITLHMEKFYWHTYKKKYDPKNISKKAKPNRPAIYVE